MVSETTPDGKASIAVKKAGKANDPAEVKIEVVPFEGGVAICAVVSTFPFAISPATWSKHRAPTDRRW